MSLTCFVTSNVENNSLLIVLDKRVNNTKHVLPEESESAEESTSTYFYVRFLCLHNTILREALSHGKTLPSFCSAIWTSRACVLVTGLFSGSTWPHDIMLGHNMGLNTRGDLLAHTTVAILPGATLEIVITFCHFATVTYPLDSPLWFCISNT